ncbi:double-stranded RNA-binding protein 1-like isoform X2 [Malania oleifera]|uniref:double-stranded RNA-binding protein 1-like isoform X2 n=1 Tax=Malania oleifera TaxID=397392 RepID=UPI0025AE097A|nr:double-stranded RNA-binding protein 1-like isoform X2 [Malania oleifera]
MYKSKLQELCHQRFWGKPQYSCSKDGPDHNPRFKASVRVNDVYFDSPTDCKSSKSAYNHAAMLAFTYFTSASPGPSMATAEPVTGEPQTDETQQSSEFHLNALCEEDDLHYQYKSQLQNYAQRKNLELPLYSHKGEGPSHALRHTAMVTVDGLTFESPESFSTLKEAEHAAAKAALMSLLPDDPQEDYHGFYKNLLQRLSQKDGLCLPVYKTGKSGKPHMPTFVSTVEIGGEIFHGKGAKSKKQAEINAAKVAYTTFKGRKRTPSSEFSSPCSPKDEAPNPNIQSPALLDMRKSVEERRSTYASLFISSKQGPSSSAMTEPLNLSAISISDSNTGKTTGIKSYLLCNKVRVYTCLPDIAFPEGITVLPISDDKWVAVNLEFPNE